MKIDQDIAKAKEKQADHEKSISRIMYRTSKLNCQLSDQKQQGESLENDNCTLQCKIMEKLQVILLSNDQDADLQVNNAVY